MKPEKKGKGDDPAIKKVKGAPPAKKNKNAPPAKGRKNKPAKEHGNNPPGHGNKPEKITPPAAPDKDDDLRLGGIGADEVSRLVSQFQTGGQKPLPPGIRKNLMRGKPLPPGIARTRLPDPFVAALPVHPGYEWQAYGTDLVLVRLATNVVADVLMDVLR